jgi:hypothetical protein
VQQNVSSLELSALLPPRDTLSGAYDERHFCGMCLLRADDAPIVHTDRHYHRACANLWLNCVDGVLPRLLVPGLL